MLDSKHFFHSEKCVANSALANCSIRCNECNQYYGQEKKRSDIYNKLSKSAKWVKSSGLADARINLCN